MSEFLQFVEQAKDASQFITEGSTTAASMSSDFLNEPNYNRRWQALQRNPQYSRMVVEALNFTKRCRGSRYGAQRFEEAMMTADFPLLMADTLDRQLLGMYQEAPYTWSNYTRRGTVPDFRTVKRFAVDGAEGVLPTVGEIAPYLPQVLKETKYSYSVVKKGRTINWSWESFINDDLDALGSSSPARLAKAARRTEEKYVTSLFVDANGPHASVFTSGNANIATANPVLSIAGLQTAMIKLAAQTDADGEPISIEAVELVVPPALEITANNILNSTNMRITTAGGSSNQEMEVVNWMRSRTRLSVNAYIPIIASSSNTNTSWFLIASPSAGRPFMELGFLRGHESPELFQRVNNQQRVGGATSPMDGSFEDDSLAYKVRHCLGGTILDPKCAVSSNGSGS